MRNEFINNSLHKMILRKRFGQVLMATRGPEDNTKTGEKLSQKEQEQTTHTVRKVLCGHEGG